MVLEDGIECMPDTSGKCPHCGVVVRFNWARGRDDRHGSFYSYDSSFNIQDGNEKIVLYFSECPECMRAIVSLHNFSQGVRDFKYLAYPRNRNRPIPQEVPGEFSKDYLEAASVIGISEQASAALSRRCLQNILNSQGYNKSQLIDCISDALDDLPTYIAESLDAIRTVGNYAAHPTKSLNSGNIVEVEPYEAVLSLDILDLLFDHYFVKPARAKSQTDTINAKLISAGKQPIKKPVKKL